VSAPSNPPRVAGIVLNYNGREVTLQALASLRRMTYPAFDLVVVDNGSTDGSSEAIAAAFPDVAQVRTEQNLGPAGGCNLGIVWALERGYPYLLLLNNDIEVDPEMLSEMMKVAEADPSLGCVGPKAYYWGDRNRIWSAGGILQFRESVTRERGQNEIDRGQYDRDGEVDFVNGCAMLVRREAFEKAGLWDPIYRLSVEDADWCFRLKRHRLRCWYAHRARLWHMVAFATKGVYKAGKTFHTGRSTMIFVRRYATPLQTLTSFLFMIAAIPAAYLRELRHGNQAAALAKARGFWEGLRTPLAPPPRWEPRQPSSLPGARREPTPGSHEEAARAR
jgi:GT2 family glycosyltransferase